MACSQPNTAWRLLDALNKNGKAVYVWKYPHNLPRHKFEEVKLPCRKCDGCRLNYAREWAIRSWHEAAEYDHNVFLTLTFNEEHMNPTGELIKSDFQKFMKRLRKFVDNYEYNFHLLKYVKRPVKLSKMDASVQQAERVRYTHCGEYGEKRLRPHHHACLFNMEFWDKYQFGTSNGLPIYNSRTLDWLWSNKKTNYEKAMAIQDDKEFQEYIDHRGWAVIGSVTFESAAYVARYITKKAQRTTKVGKQAEYMTQSRNPGIGRAWIDKYYTDVYPFDFIGLTDDRKMKVPRYYDKVFEKIDDTEYNLVKQKRILLAKQNKGSLEEENYKMRTNEIISKQTMRKLIRSYENEPGANS